MMSEVYSKSRMMWCYPVSCYYTLITKNLCCCLVKHHRCTMLLNGYNYFSKYNTKWLMFFLIVGMHHLIYSCTLHGTIGCCHHKLQLFYSIYTVSHEPHTVKLILTDITQLKKNRTRQNVYTSFTGTIILQDTFSK